MYILVVMELKSRQIEVSGVTAIPMGNGFDKSVGISPVPMKGSCGTRQLLVDRDTKFQPMREYLTDCARLKPVLLLPRSPNLNSYLERYMRSLKSEALDRMNFFGEGSLRSGLKSYVLHYHSERNHQGLENRLIDPGPEVGSVAGKIECRERLGGLLRYYHRAA